MFEDTKAVIRGRKSKDRKYNGQKIKDKRTDKQCTTNHYITQKTKDPATWTPLNHQHLLFACKSNCLVKTM